MKRYKGTLEHYKTTTHAVTIMLDLANARDELATTGEIGGRIGISRQNVHKIVNLLSKAGLLTCVRGWQGGVRLSRPASEITVGDVVRAIELRSLRENGAGPSGDGKMFNKARLAFLSVLDQHTLADLAKRPDVIPKVRNTQPLKPAKAIRARTRAGHSVGKCSAAAASQAKRDASE